MECKADFIHNNEREELLREHMQRYLRDNSEDALAGIYELSGDLLGFQILPNNNKNVIEMSSATLINENFKLFMGLINDAVENLDSLIQSVASGMAVKTIERKFDEVGELRKLAERIDKDENSTKEVRDSLFGIGNELNEKLTEIRSNIKNKKNTKNIEDTAEPFNCEECNLEVEMDDNTEMASADENDATTEDAAELANDEECNLELEIDDTDELASDGEEEIPTNILHQDMRGYDPQYISIMGHMICENSWAGLMLGIYKHFHEKGPLKFGSFAGRSNASEEKAGFKEEVDPDFAVEKDILKKPGRITDSLFVELDKSENEFRDDILTLLKYYDVDEEDIKFRLKKKCHQDSIENSLLAVWLTLTS